MIQNSLKRIHKPEHFFPNNQPTNQWVEQGEQHDLIGRWLTYNCWIVELLLERKKKIWKLLPWLQDILLPEIK